LYIITAILSAISRYICYS